MREPLLLPACAITAGILFDRLQPFSRIEAWLPALAFLLLAISAALIRSALCTRLTIYGLLVFVGAGISIYHRPPEPPTLDAAAHETVILEGCIVEPPEFGEDRATIVLELDPGARIRVSLPIAEGATPPALHYGQRVELDARVRQPQNFRNPGAFDYKQYLANRNIYWLASMPARSQPRILPGECGQPFYKAAYLLRTGALTRIDQVFGAHEYSARMLKAILLGDTLSLEKVWTENFRRTGTYHALVISGLHVSVLAGVFLFIFRLIIPRMIPALILTGTLAWLYALASGFTAPVVRAAAGFTLFTIARLAYRKGRLLNILAATSIGFIIFDPSQITDPSFQLSMLSVLAIGAFSIPIIERTTGPYAEAMHAITEPRRDFGLAPQAAQFRVELRLLAETAELCLRIPQKHFLTAVSYLLRGFYFTWELMLVSGVMQVALALPMVIYFHRVSFTGLTANLLIVPMMNAVVPLGFAAITPGLAWLKPFVELLLTLSDKAAAWHVALEPGMRMPAPPLWLGLLFLAILCMTAIAIRLNWRFAPALTIPIAACFAALIIYPFPSSAVQGNLELTAIDVGQGDSLILIAPNGSTLLMDTGGLLSLRKSKPRLDIGEDVVLPYLLSRGFKKLDVLAISHPHADHAAGAPALIESLRPTQLWIGTIEDVPLWHEIRQAAAKAGTRIVIRQRGQQFAWQGVQMSVLAPSHETRSHINEDGLVIRAQYRNRSLLLTGDIEKASEYDIELANQLTPVDILKVAHHGSRTSSTREFLDATQPKIALISVGRDNFYRHPNPDVIARLGEYTPTILRTDKLGLITVRTDGDRITLDTMAWSPSGPALPPLF